jgi:hypothetical protein
MGFLGLWDLGFINENHMINDESQQLHIAQHAGQSTF